MLAMDTATQPVLSQQLQSLINGSELYSRREILSTTSLPPSVPGVYAWFFKDIPGNALIDGCVTQGPLTLLYVGISPDKIGKPNSRQNLRRRITTHFQGNAEGSTLRRSLGVLLTETSGYPLRRVGSGKRMTLTHSGEQWLDEWMAQNAFVCWLQHETPWELEGELLGSLSLPLNIKGNRDHLFAKALTEARVQAIRDARERPIAVENNQRRISKVATPSPLLTTTDTFF